METIQQTARAVTSKPVQRAVLNTILAVFGAVSLLCVAGVATALFFQNFVPDKLLSTPVHLQYGSGINPYGIAPLVTPSPKTAQEYDVSLTLSLPRSPPNLERGNFMVSIYLLDSPSTPSLLASASQFASSTPHDHDFASSTATSDFGLTRSILFHSRRPALVPYVDPVISTASRVLFVFWHLLFPERTEMCKMTIKLAEKVAFPRLTGVPRSAYVEVEAGQTIQIYDATLTLTAQLSGLRYLMTHYRLPTYLLFTFFFWLFEVLFMAGAFIVFSSSPAPSATSLKLKEQQLKRRRAMIEEQTEATTSDHPHDFPTYGKQPRLKHEPPEKIKRESDEQEEKERLMAELPVAGTEADDEDDYVEDEEKRDSGIGTSYSEEGKHSVRRRASRNLME